MNNTKKIITGDWDGEKIWRRETSEERLHNVLPPLITREEFDQHDCHQSPEDGCAVCEKFYNQHHVQVTH